ncbi:MAG: hypothetical protein RBU36_18390 [Thermoanaerobaculia bacterium]|nr:hypothetical protein [Thermoanaerobaculia bacterium]
MTELVLHRSRSGEVDALARSHVAEGSISVLETPALLRRVARERLGAEIELRVVVVVAFPFNARPEGEFTLVEYEARPGVWNYRLARVPGNCARSIRLGAFERAMRRAWRALGRRFAGAVHVPTAITPAPVTARLLSAASSVRAALPAGPPHP